MHRKWLAVFPVVAAAAVTFGASSDACADPFRVSADVYDRAMRFMYWNRDRYAVNGAIQPKWGAGADYFTYGRHDQSGQRTFLVVDAVTGRVDEAFDHEKVAAGLARELGSSVLARNLPFAQFELANDRKWIRFSTAGRSFECVLATGSCTPLPGIDEAASSSPDGRWQVYVERYNLRVRDTTHGQSFALTTNGELHHDYASSPEDNTRTITEIRQGKRQRPHVIWSPDSRHILTHRLDQRPVKDMHLLQSVPEDGSARPKLYTYKYALPGDEHIPLAQMYVFDVATRSQIKLDIAPLAQAYSNPVEREYAWWSADSRKVYVLARERFSKSLSLYVADPRTGSARELIRETGGTKVEIGDVYSRPVVRTLANGDVIWLSERDGWSHLYYYDGDTGKVRAQLTKGSWVVRDIVRVDEARRTIYFRGSGRTPTRDLYYQALYSVRFDGTALKRLTPEDADHSLPAAGAPSDGFSPSGRYFIDTHSRPDLPPVTVLRGADGRLVKELERADVSALRAGGFSMPEPFEALAADGKTPLLGTLQRPSDFDPSKKYPVIDVIYPGPITRMVTKTFNETVFSVQQVLADLGFVVVTVDGRGTPHRSKEFKDDSYGQLGKAGNLEDHVAVLRELGRRFDYLDLGRVGIYGKSGGGFAAARAILTYPDLYKVAVAICGNHDQRGYVSRWGETYIGPYDEGLYLAAANQPLAGNLRGRLLLAHGELDDNVHPALTLKLVDALVKANKDFDLLIVPNVNHGMAPGILSTYVLRRTMDYFVFNLMGAQPPREYAISMPDLARR